MRNNNLLLDTLMAFYKRVEFTCTGDPTPVQGTPLFEQAMVLSRDAYNPHKEGIFKKKPNNARH